MVRDKVLCFLSSFLIERDFCVLVGERGHYSEQEYLEWFPAAPASLDDYFVMPLEQVSGANILMIGEYDDLRDSVVLHSICGFLMNSQTKVIANFIDENNPDRARIIELLQKINSKNLELRAGLDNVMNTIRSLQRIKPVYGQNVVYLWYGLDKLKNEIFLRMQDDEETENTPNETNNLNFEASPDEDMDALIAEAAKAIEEANTEFRKPVARIVLSKDDILPYDQCISILKTAYDAGPENGIFNFVLFNNYKSMDRSKIISRDSFENIVSTKISADDSFALFNSSQAVKKADDDTIVYSNGGGKIMALRPYLLPDKQWLGKFNTAIDGRI